MYCTESELFFYRPNQLLPFNYLCSLTESVPYEYLNSWILKAESEEHNTEHNEKFWTRLVLELGPGCCIVVQETRSPGWIHPTSSWLVGVYMKLQEPDRVRTLEPQLGNKWEPNLPCRCRSRRCGSRRSRCGRSRRMCSWFRTDLKDSWWSSRLPEDDRDRSYETQRSPAYCKLQLKV